MFVSLCHFAFTIYVLVGFMFLSYIAAMNCEPKSNPMCAPEIEITSTS